jgi:hypothetical protein
MVPISCCGIVGLVVVVFAASCLIAANLAFDPVATIPESGIQSFQARLEP